MHRQGQEEETIIYLRLCFDVLLEVLRFGKRHSLCKLERVGRHFHCVIENFFPDVPFFRLDLDLKPMFVSFFHVGTQLSSYKEVVKVFRVKN